MVAMPCRTFPKGVYARVVYETWDQRFDLFSVVVLLVLMFIGRVLCLWVRMHADCVNWRRCHSLIGDEIGVVVGPSARHIYICVCVSALVYWMSYLLEVAFSVVCAHWCLNNQSLLRRQLAYQGAVLRQYLIMSGHRFYKHIFFLGNR